MMLSKLLLCTYLEVLVLNNASHDNLERRSSRTCKVEICSEYKHILV